MTYREPAPREPEPEQLSDFERLERARDAKWAADERARLVRARWKRVGGAALIAFVWSVCTLVAYHRGEDDFRSWLSVTGIGLAIVVVVVGIGLIVSAGDP